MAKNIENRESALLKDMKARIDEIERLALELKDIGRGLPVIEKNVQCILSFSYVLKFGISDLV